MSTVSLCADGRESPFSPDEERWARFGAYYAMFPVDFAMERIEKYSDIGDGVLDPFAGRGTSIYAAAVLGRKGVGIEINPVGWVYGKTKIAPADKNKVLARLNEIGKKSARFQRSADAMPHFFHVCFCREVRQFLLAARKYLNWKQSIVDTTLMAFIILHLHGKKGDAMSNQMKQTKAMSPEYSLRWWKDNGRDIPPEINSVDYLREKIERRYAKGAPQFKKDARIYLGDSVNLLSRIARHGEKSGKKFSLLFTSPPYWSLVNYYLDQWLRLWVLGGDDRPRTLRDKNKGRFLSQKDYRFLLHSVFYKCAKVLSPQAIIYVRTDIREFTRHTTREVLEACFPRHKVCEEESYSRQTQSRLFGNVPSVKKPGEVDIIMSPST